MQRNLSFLLALSLIGSASVAQVAAPETTPSVSPHGDEPAVETVTLSTPTGKMTAHVYMPAMSRHVAGVVFSHSRVKYQDGTTDLLPLASRVSKAGAAVIVVDRTLVWPIQGGDTNRDGGIYTIAALRWLLSNADVDTTRCAYAGPMFRDPKDPDRLRTLGYEDGIQPSPWVPLGEPNNSSNMTSIKKPEGQIFVEHFLRKRLGLGDTVDIDQSTPRADPVR
jgi:hypothetical protein